MMLCGKPIKTIESLKPCICNAGHLGGCNPFSNNPNIPPDAPVTMKQAKEAIIEARATFKTCANCAATRMCTLAGACADLIPERMERSESGEVKLQCFWQGAHGRCVLEFGHFPSTPHKEDFAKVE